MNWLKKLRSLTVVVFVFGFLISASLSSCGNKGNADEKESTEHPAADSVEKADPPKAEAEHPKNDSDSTKVEQPK